MPRLANALGSLAAISLAAAFCVAPSWAQSGPADIPGVLAICAPVIGEEYNGDDDRWGQCVAAVDSFMDAIDAPSDPANPIIADLVVALTELYQNDEDCEREETELPEAIELAAQHSTDAVQQAQIIEVAATIKDCAVFLTAAIPVRASAF